MALSGTIQDFGVADIFQLISQQVKTGRLSLSNGVETVMVLFREGAVVHAENATTPGERLFGNLLLRADLIEPWQLERGLEEQQRTLKRIGSVLIELGFVDEEAVVEFARLQMTETLYSLFAWNRGTYEFESLDVEPSPDGVAPIRAEHVVMNGIRMTDEWPSIREQIPSYTWTVERMRALPPPVDRPARSDALDFTLGGPEDPIGESERIVEGLISPGRTVQKVIDLSRLGEFETCRALSELTGEGYIRIVKPKPLEAGGPSATELWRRAAFDVGRVLVSFTLVVLSGLLVARAVAERKAPRELAVEGRAVERRLEAVQRRVLDRALEVYRFRNGHFPATLEALVAEGLLDAQDIVHPRGQPYVYVPRKRGYDLAAPLL